MLYSLIEWLQETYGDIPGLGVFKYLSFRAALAILFSLIISLLIGKRIIRLLKQVKIREIIREHGPDHASKAGTPTMGGLIIMAAIIIPTLLWADLSNMYVLLILFATIWMGVIGFIDDYIKVFKKNKAGLQGKFKIVGQVGIGLIVGCVMVFHPAFKGPTGRISEEGKLTLDGSEILQETGFQKGDILYRVDGLEWNSGEVVASAPSTYLVDRPVDNGRFKVYQPYTVVVPPAQKDAVWSALTGQRDVGFQTETNAPFMKDYVLNYSLLAFWEEDPDGMWGKIIYILIAIFIVTAVSNGVNITDGLDGLAAGTTAISVTVLAIFAYLGGNVIFADYLNISYIPGAAELFIFCAAMIGACVGFLWYNTYPAAVFMGDTGSLMLGGAVGVLAMMVKKELLLLLICGVFFIESVSVIMQVAYFKYTKRKYGEGRRIFLMAPLHHHYEKKGMHEVKIVVRFWIAAILLAILAFVTLKLR